VETKSEVLRRQARADDLDDMVTQVMTAACGVTINCARCHDHKLDPILQREYYALTAVFAGVKRQDRGTSDAADRQYAHAKADITAGITKARVNVHTLAGKPIDLADIVGGGDGRGTGKKGFGIDPRSGKARDAKAEGFLGDIKVNKLSPGPPPLVNAVFIPNGPGDVPVSTTGLVVKGIPETSVAAWDVIRNGPVNQQFSTKLVSPKLGEVDYAKDSHTILGLHANAGITFDLAEIAKQARLANPRFRGVVGYGGRTAEAGADFFVFIDGGEQGLKKFAITGYTEENLARFFDAPFTEPRPPATTLRDSAWPICGAIRTAVALHSASTRRPRCNCSNCALSRVMRA
jgi:hypothetical protein